MGVFKRTRTNKHGKKVDFWYMRYSLNGKMKWEQVGKVGVVTKDVARAKYEERKKQIRLGQLDIIGAHIPTLQEFSNEYINYVRDVVGKRSWSRDELCLKHLNGFFGDLKLSAINVKDIQDYQSNRLRKGLKPATVNREVACLKHLFNIAKQRSNFFCENPVSNVKFLEENNQKERVLTLDEEERLISSSPPYLKPIIKTALNTGMRKSEIISLKWSNIDFDYNIITIEATNSKSKRIKRIPINSLLRKVLFEQKLRTGFSDYVFVNSNGVPYKKQNSLKTCFELARKKANVEDLRFHDLRHTAATRMVEVGGNIVAVSKILGHADLRTTMRYAHPDNSLRETVEKLGNFNSNCSRNCSQENV